MARAKEERGERALARREPQDPWMAQSPFTLMRRLTEDMDRFFEDFWSGRGIPAVWRGEGLARGWTPEIEMFQRGNELVVRAELPGLKKEDVQVELSEDQILIQGERRHEETEEREGLFRTERRYGAFRRAVPLPEGAIADSAKASFKDGVLEITLQAPPHGVASARKLEIT